MDSTDWKGFTDAAPGKAAAYLKSTGLEVLDREWPCSHGVLPMVAADRHPRILVAVEIKVTSRSKAGLIPPMAVERRRQMRRMALAWMQAHGMSFERVRVDIVSVIKDGPGGFTVEHYKGYGD
jgi:putative endonuclease